MPKQPKTGLFFWHDTEGIPPEIALRHLKVGVPDQFLMLCQYAIDAVRAGWSVEKVRGEMRDLHYLGIEVPAFFRPDKVIANLPPKES